MAKQCIEYKMHLNPEGRLMVPPWIEDPGYYKSDNTYLGFTPIESEREYYLPDTVTIMSETDVVNRCLAIHAVTPFQTGIEPEPSTTMTTEEVTQMVTNWYQSKIAE
jgi:hypothetical protein